MRKNEVREGEVKAQKEMSRPACQRWKNLVFFEPGSPSFQTILGSEDKEDDYGDLAWRVGDLNMLVTPPLPSVYTSIG
jgi:hypothetical protein